MYYMENISSQYISDLYIRSNDDENVFALIDSIGINIIRKYKKDTIPARKNYRMFIRLFITATNTVRGGVDVVKDNSDESNPGFPLVFEEDDTLINIFRRKYTSFTIDGKEKIEFSSKTNEIIFRNREFSINQFVELLVYNHVHDMFFRSRILNYLKNFFVLEPAFYLANLNYRDLKTRFNFILKKNTNEKIDNSKIEAIMRGL